MAAALAPADDSGEWPSLSGKRKSPPIADSGKLHQNAEEQARAILRGDQPHQAAPEVRTPVDSTSAPSLPQPGDAELRKGEERAQAVSSVSLIKGLNAAAASFDPSALAVTEEASVLYNSPDHSGPSQSEGEEHSHRHVPASLSPGAVPFTDPFAPVLPSSMSRAAVSRIVGSSYHAQHASLNLDPPLSPRSRAPPHEAWAPPFHSAPQIVAARPSSTDDGIVRMRARGPRVFGDDAIQERRSYAVPRYPPTNGVASVPPAFFPPTTLSPQYRSAYLSLPPHGWLHPATGVASVPHDYQPNARPPQQLQHLPALRHDAPRTSVTLERPSTAPEHTLTTHLQPPQERHSSTRNAEMDELRRRLATLDGEKKALELKVASLAAAAGGKASAEPTPSAFVDLGEESFELVEEGSPRALASFIPDPADEEPTSFSLPARVATPSPVTPEQPLRPDKGKVWAAPLVLHQINTRHDVVHADPPEDDDTETLEELQSRIDRWAKLVAEEGEASGEAPSLPAASPSTDDSISVRSLTEAFGKTTLVTQDLPPEKKSVPARARLRAGQMPLGNKSTNTRVASRWDFADPAQPPSPHSLLTHSAAASSAKVSDSAPFTYHLDLSDAIASINTSCRGDLSPLSRESSVDHAAHSNAGTGSMALFNATDEDVPFEKAGRVDLVAPGRGGAQSLSSGSVGAQTSPLPDTDAATLRKRSIASWYTAQDTPTKRPLSARTLLDPVSSPAAGADAQPRATKSEASRRPFLTRAERARGADDIFTTSQ